MSTISSTLELRDLHRVKPRSARGIPPLINGDRLSQPEFHRRYEAMPSHVRAELIGGIVYMASPLRMPHGTNSYKLITVLGTYEAATPGVEGMDNTTAILDDDSEPQPDIAMRLLPERGGQTHVNSKDYLVGAPELVIEVAHSTEAIDLHSKMEDYRKAGVLEYLVLCLDENEQRSFDLPSSKPFPLQSDGVFRSRAFPGLWIDSAAAVAGDARKLLATLRRGLKSAEHRAFVKELKPRGSSSRRKNK